LPSIVSEGSNLFQPVFGIVVKPLKTLLAVGLCKQAISRFDRWSTSEMFGNNKWATVVRQNSARL